MRQPNRQTRRRRRGITFVELLVAGLLLSIGLMAIVQTWAYSFFVTTKSDESAIAYNLGRQAIERAKTSGFSSLAEGTTTAYYNGRQEWQGTSSTSHYTVTTAVTSDYMASGTSGVSGGVPRDWALRLVRVTVTLTSSRTELYRTSTYLSRYGI